MNLASRMLPLVVLVCLAPLTAHGQTALEFLRYSPDTTVVLSALTADDEQIVRDDLAGGLTDADKILLNNVGETADGPGEMVFDGDCFTMRDNRGSYDPRFTDSLVRRRFSFDFLIPVDMSLLSRCPIIEDGVEVRIDQEGELYVL